MPRFDRTGPGGQGSQTGRKLGKCNLGNQRTTEQLDVKETSGGKGRRLERGLGRGLGRRNGKGNA